MIIYSHNFNKANKFTSFYFIQLSTEYHRILGFSQHPAASLVSRSPRLGSPGFPVSRVPEPSSTASRVPSDTLRIFQARVACWKNSRVLEEASKPSSRGKEYPDRL